MGGKGEIILKLIPRNLLVETDHEEVDRKAEDLGAQLVFLSELPMYG